MTGALSPLARSPYNSASRISDVTTFANSFSSYRPDQIPGGAHTDCTNVPCFWEPLTSALLLLMSVADFCFLTSCPELNEFDAGLFSPDIFASRLDGSGDVLGVVLNQTLIDAVRALSGNLLLR